MKASAVREAIGMRVKAIGVRVETICSGIDVRVESVESCIGPSVESVEIEKAVAVVYSIAKMVARAVDAVAVPHGTLHVHIH